jgi:hypothetical protein
MSDLGSTSFQRDCRPPGATGSRPAPDLEHLDAALSSTSTDLMRWKELCLPVTPIPKSSRWTHLAPLRTSPVRLGEDRQHKMADRAGRGIADFGVGVNQLLFEPVI